MTLLRSKRRRVEDGREAVEVEAGEELLVAALAEGVSMVGKIQTVADATPKLG